MKIFHQVVSDSYMEGTGGTQEAMWEAGIETVVVIVCENMLSINLLLQTTDTLDLYVSYQYYTQTIYL